MRVNHKNKFTVLIVERLQHRLRVLEKWMKQPLILHSDSRPYTEKSTNFFLNLPVPIGVQRHARETGPYTLEKAFKSKILFCPFNKRCSDGFVKTRQIMKCGPWDLKYDLYFSWKVHLRVGSSTKRTTYFVKATYSFSHWALKWGCKNFQMTGCRMKYKCVDLHRDIKKCAKNIDIIWFDIILFKINFSIRGWLESCIKNYEA